VELVAWLNAKQKWGWEHDSRVGGWIKWQFWFQWRELQKEGEDTLVNYFYQLPLAPSSSEVPLAPILGTSPKLNRKLNLEFNHVLEAPTTMQSYCISGDENASLKPTHDENTPPRLTHLGSNSMPRQGNVIDTFQQSMYMTSDCTQGVAKGNDDPSTWLSVQQRKTMKKCGNWDNASRKLTMESVEVGNNL